MEINSVQNTNQRISITHRKQNKREIIDYIADNVRNPRDINDCVTVPRGIFKAYIYLMTGSSCGLVANALPQKWKAGKIIFNILCALLSTISAVYFAKPFAVEGLSPTVKKDVINKS